MLDSRRPPYGYSIGLMTEYVAEMISCLVLDSTPVSARFHTSLYALLVQTELPGATVLLGLTYLSRRTQTLPIATRAERPAEAEDRAWRMLAVAVMLGSKYLDDGTYDHTSWAAVSAISKANLNRLEREWLEAVHWCLFVNLDLDEAYNAWITSWQGWLYTKTVQMTQNLTAAWLPVSPVPPYAPSLAEVPIFFLAGQGDRHGSGSTAWLRTPVDHVMSQGATAHVRHPNWPSTSPSPLYTTSFSWRGGDTLGDLGGPVGILA
ncbi:cyclin-like protein [Sporothrix eucalyptigena]|uniref:Cyclin-like protein n=1 Tax=Sporothrix eucalyptigena TaxID=1812306 RepID=A0ABP0D192_9PEZI